MNTSTKAIRLQIIRKPRGREKRAALAERMEALGRLEDEYQRLQAMPILDRASLLRLADEYERRGCRARAFNIRREAG